MPHTRIRLTSTVAFGVGLALMILGAYQSLNGTTPAVLAGAPAESVLATRTNPDDVLMDEALEVRRRVAEFKQRAGSQHGEPPLDGMMFLCGGLLSVAGAAGRIAARRSASDAEPV